jgi:hypothetical protein
MDYTQRILENTKEQNGCFLYQGVKDRDGYGFITTGPKAAKRTIRVHRYICSKFYGEPLEKSNFALHSCDQPSCVNPDHLSWGSHSENRKQARDRLQNLKGQKLTKEIVEKIRTYEGSNSETAKKFGISRSYAGYLKRGFYWI